MITKRTHSPNHHCALCKLLNYKASLIKCVANALGSEDEDGIFTVKDVCWAGCGIQKPLPKLSSDRYDT